MKVFIDTNIFIDLICNREPFVQEAKYVFALGMTQEVVLYASTLTIVNTVYIGKHYHIDQQELKNKINDSKGFITWLDITAGQIEESLNEDWKDFEDSVQYHCAKSEQVDCIVTRDKSGFNLSSIPIYSPSEFLNLFSLPKQK